MRSRAILLILLFAPLVLLISPSAAWAEGGSPWGSGAQSWSGGSGRHDDRNSPSTHYDAFNEFSDLGINSGMTMSTWDDQPMPEAEESPQIVQAAVAGLLSLLFVLGVVLLRRDKTPERALKESEKTSGA